MSRDEILAKFQQLASSVAAPERIAALRRAIAGLPEADDLGELAGAAARARRTGGVAAMTIAHFSREHPMRVALADLLKRHRALPLQAAGIG